jgi:hypothetical protein
MRPIRPPVAPNAPRSIRVRANGKGQPIAVDGVGVEAIVDDWLMHDRWWTRGRIHRRYWRVVTVRGRFVEVFRDLRGGGWYTHAGSSRRGRHSSVR